MNLSVSNGVHSTLEIGSSKNLFSKQLALSTTYTPTQVRLPPPLACATPVVKGGQRTAPARPRPSSSPGLTCRVHVRDRELLCWPSTHPVVSSLTPSLWDARTPIRFRRRTAAPPLHPSRNRCSERHLTLLSAPTRPPPFLAPRPYRTHQRVLRFLFRCPR